MQNKFLERLSKLRLEKASILCVSLDLDPNGFTRSEYLERVKSMMKAVSDYVIAFKVNENFTRHLSIEDHREISKLCRALNTLSIYDCKLGDIGSSASLGVKLIKDMGYDALTVNPTFGNLKEIVDVAHSNDVAVIAVTIPSSEEAQRIFRAKIDGKMLFEVISEDVRNSGADGVVLGATNYVKPEDIIRVREIIGNDPLILFTGIGAQGGDFESAILFGGWNIMLNVGRAIINSKDPTSASAEYRRLLTDAWIKFNAAKEIATSKDVYCESKDAPFTLSSGKKSDYYIDIRSLYSQPTPRGRIAELMLMKIALEGMRDVEKVATTETAGIPIASIVADRLSKGLVYVRHKEKSYGKSKKVEGIVKQGDVFICVDDLTTTGETATFCINAIRELGGEVMGYFVVFDREEGAEERLKEIGVKLFSLTNITILRRVMDILKNR